MKNLVRLLIAACFVNLAAAQDFTGNWGGALSVGGTELPLVFHISKTEAGYSSTMDSPMQGVKDIPVSTTVVEGNTIVLKIERGGIEYTGTLGDDKVITGVFKQSGQAFNLVLTREGAAKTTMNRPQEPKAPYPYYTEDVTFKNPKAGNIELAGTLSLPAKTGKFPVVILISGSGPQNRNEALLGHQPFLVLADDLTRKGIGVLRFDDRGTGASKGDFASATTMDFATDVEAALAYLQTRKEIDKKQIGLIGHSEGGIIAPIVASRNKNISYIVLLAGTGIRGAELLLLQERLIGRAEGMSENELTATTEVNKKAFDIVLENEDPVVLEQKLRVYLTEEIAKLPDSLQDPKLIDKMMQQLNTPWMTTFIRFDPAMVLQQVKCPVLALNGSKDLQVPAEQNLPAIKAALERGGNNNVTATELPGLNHLFQECVTGSPKEYAAIEQTFSPIALNAVSEWILQQMK